MGISAVSATFFWIFFGFWVDFGSCFKSFMDYSSTRACLLCYQPMAIVHYANLVLLNKYTFLTEVGTRAPGTDGAPVRSCKDAGARRTAPWTARFDGFVKHRNPKKHNSYSILTVKRSLQESTCATPDARGARTDLSQKSIL